MIPILRPWTQQPPLGDNYRVNPHHPLLAGCIHFWHTLGGEPITDAYGRKLTYTRGAGATLSMPERWGKTIGFRNVVSSTAQACGYTVTVPDASGGTVTIMARKYINAFDTDINIGGWAEGWSWLDTSGGVLRVSAYTTYDTTNPISIPGEYTVGLIWRPDNTYQTLINGRFSQSGSATRSAIGTTYDTGSNVLRSMQYSGRDAVNSIAFWNGAWARELTQAEIADLHENPWQVFEPRRIWVPVSVAGGAATHTTTGALAAAAATISGTAAHNLLHATSGTLTAAAATISGTAAHTSPGVHPTSGALAAQAAAISGTAAHLTLHAASGTLTASVATVSGAAVHTGPGATVEVPQQGGGRPTRRRRRIQVEIDGEVFEAADETEALALLDQAKAEAQDLAQKAVARAAKKANSRPSRKIIGDARRALKPPEISVPDALQSAADSVLSDIRGTYADALQTIEIAALMARREHDIELDDEDVLMLL